MKKQNLHRACPICRNKDEAEQLLSEKFILSDNHPLPSINDIVSCNNCGFVFTDTPGKQEIYDKYYSEMSKYEMDFIATDSLMYIERAAWIKLFIHNTNDSIIDVGCGNGQLLIELQKLGYTDLTGLDPSMKSIRGLNAKGIQGTTNSIFSFSTTKKFDCVILSGVMEHIYDIYRIMENIKQFLKLNGLFFVFVPDAARYRNYDTVPFDYFNVEHINHFEETSLLNLGFQHGFITISFLKTTITLGQTRQPVLFWAYKNVKMAAVDMRVYSRNCIIEYLAQTKECSMIFKKINKLIETKEEIILWGAGNFSSRLLAGFGLDQCNIVMIVDNDKHKHGTIINGKNVYPPKAILERKINSTILIGAAVFYKEILDEIQQMGLNNKIIALHYEK